MNDDKLDDLDLLLKEVYKKNKDRLAGSDQIVIPSAEHVLKGYRQRDALTQNNNRYAEHKSSAKRHFLNLSIKVAAIMFLLFCTSLIYSVAARMPEVKAFKFSFIKSLVQIKQGAISITHSNIVPDGVPSDPPFNVETKGDTSDTIVEKLSLDKIRSKLGNMIVVPNYVPQGYTLEDSELTRIMDISNVIKQVYKSENGTSFFILKQTTGQNDINLKTVTSKQNSVKQYKAMGEDCIIICSDQSSFQAIWFKDDSKFDLICTNMNENEVLKIIDNIKVQ